MKQASRFVADHGLTPRRQDTPAISVDTALKLLALTMSGLQNRFTSLSQFPVMSLLEASILEAAAGRKAIYMSDLQKACNRVMSNGLPYRIHAPLSSRLSYFIQTCRPHQFPVRGLVPEWYLLNSPALTARPDLVARRQAELRIIERDLPYLPAPSVAELLITDVLAPTRLTPTTFAIPYSDDGIWVANNTRRGLEFPGGHVEPGESISKGARRETVEETGLLVKNLQPIGVKVCRAHHDDNGRREDLSVQDGYRYPYPNSFMQFWMGEVAERFRYHENDECLSPLFIPWDEVRAFLAEDGGRLFPDLDRPYRRELLKEVYRRAGPRQASR